MPVPAGITVAWPSTAASIPSGWDRVTALDGRHPRGAPAATDPGGTGGSATHQHTTPGHTHTVASHTHAGITTGGPSGTVNFGGFGSGSSASRINHRHTIPTTGAQTATLSSDGVSFGAASSEPSYYEVIWIASDGTPAGIPASAWVYWSQASLPTDWSLPVAAQGRYLKGAPAAGDGGGTGGGSHSHSGAAHTHAIAAHAHSIADTSNAVGFEVSAGTGPGDAPLTTHTHSNTVASAADSGSGSATSGATGSTTNAPAARELAVIQNDTGGDSLPAFTVAIWTGTIASIPAGWALCDGTAGTVDMRGLFAVGTSTVGSYATTGSDSHDHTDPATHTHSAAHTHTFATTGAPNPPGTDTIESNSGGVAHNGHTHTGGASGSGGGTSGSGTETVDATTALPPYYEVAFVQLQVFPQTATPDPVIVTLSIPTPTLIHGEVTATPDPVAVPVVVPAPTLAASYVATPDPVVITTAVPEVTFADTAQEAAPDPVPVPVVVTDPTLAHGEVVATPAPVTVPILVPDPTVLLAYVAHPDPVTVPVVVTTPALLFGEKVIIPDPVVVPIVIPDPSLFSGFFVTPDPVVIRITLPDPVLGNIVGLRPVTLPPATAAQVEDALAGRRGPVALRFRYTRRTRTNGFVDEITGIDRPGSITLDNRRAVVRDLDITFNANLLPSDFNASNDIIGIDVEVYVPVAQQWVSMPVGLYVLDVSQRRNRPNTELIPAKGADLAMLLVRSVRTAAYTVPAGTNYVTAVTDIISRHGLAYSIPPSPLTVPNDLTWGPGTTDYQITRDLLFGINYYPLWADATGRLRSRERIDPATESAAVTYRDTAEPRLVSAEDDVVLATDRKPVNRAVVVIDDPRHADYGYALRENADSAAPNSTAALAYGTAVAISTSSADSPSVITTATAHGFSTGVQVLISGHAGSTPDINGSHIVDVLSPTTFSIPVAVSVAGAGGTVQATTVQQEAWDGDSDPPTKAIADMTRAEAIAESELRWAAIEAQPMELPTFIDPRRDAREFYVVDLGGVEDGQLYAVLGWRMTLEPGRTMQHQLGRVQSLDLLSPPKG